MAKIKCSCGSPDCKTELYIDSTGIRFIDKKGDETLMYLDANSMVSLILAARAALNEKANM